jgi:uncharacterized protein
MSGRSSPAVLEGFLVTAAPEYPNARRLGSLIMRVEPATPIFLGEDPSRGVCPMTSQQIPDYLRVKTPDELHDILSELRQGLEALYEDHLAGLYLYGSYARGDARPGSDLDVLGVLHVMDSPTEEIERTSRLCAEISLEHGITISLLLRSADDWCTAVTPLIRSVRSEGRAA